ncbi:MAG: DNA mismatch endonuclease Vsr [Alphaproteobacteria bacterium]|nr:DNA mismatch endonuclease Vsr [Alphaproteobacteria bacterium]NCQ66890.1 DNA mismatch endonuclease Vsr [Alphaproteobacteria bacterium]NCT07458.1 DNA mismatch endonuclease Vsr [Alphaproteobacteria bacterium]
MDIFSENKRSAIMAAIKSKNTKPEVLLRKALFKKGYRYSLHTKNIRGRPDIFLRKYNAAIFFHGCFWHGHTCKAGKLPNTRQEFWEKKISINKERDALILADLKKKPIRVLYIWGCALKGKGKERLEQIINKATIWLNTEDVFFEIDDRSFD